MYLHRRAGTLTQSLIATTVLGSASTSTEPWPPRTTRRMPLPVPELPPLEEIPGHLGTTGKRTLRLRMTRLLNLRSCENSRPS